MAAGVREIAPRPKRPWQRLRFREAAAFYLFASPWLIGLVLWTLGPMIASLVLSFTDYEFVRPESWNTWVGFKNYVKMFEDDLVWQALKVTTIYAFAAIPLGLVFSFGLALLMNQPIRGIYAARTIYYIPAVVSGVPVALLWMWMLNPEFGLVNNFLAMLGIDGPDWFFSIQWVVPSFILMSLWAVGAPMIIYLAGLQGIPAHLYEAAEIDGAGPFTKFRHVTVPMISPVLLYNLVIGIIGSFQIFTPAYVITDGRPAHASLFYVLYLFWNAFRYFKMGYASAMAWLLFFIILLFTLVIFRTARTWVYYEGSLRD